MKSSSPNGAASGPSSAQGMLPAKDAKASIVGEKLPVPVRTGVLTTVPVVQDRSSPNEGGAILIVDDDASHAEATADALAAVGYLCDIARSGTAGLEALRRKQYDLVLTDLVMSDVSGIEILKHAQSINPFVAVMVLTGHASVKTAVEAMKQGAFDYLEKPLNIDALRIKVEKALEMQELRRINQSQRRQLGERFGFEGIIGNSDKMRRVVEVCMQIAPTDASILITGETGTGKDLVAKAIHNNSLRKDRHFVPINCAAFSPQLIESELFGHEKGSFTGALSQRKGVFEHAHRGTLFLDEVGDIPLDVQTKLLRALENREVTRVGSNEPTRVDVRLISATHRDLEAFVKQGQFREDLYYRLKVVTVHIPPLRDRPQDVPLLVDHFIRQFSEAYHKPITGISREALSVLSQAPWKGNVRELKHVIENMVVTARDQVLGIDSLPEALRPARAVSGAASAVSLSSLSSVPVKDVERELIKNTLAEVEGNRHAAAKLLGIGERTLYRKIKKYELH